MAGGGGKGAKTWVILFSLDLIIVSYFSTRTLTYTLIHMLVYMYLLNVPSVSSRFFFQQNKTNVS